jgi:hypothetical protein
MLLEAHEQCRTLNVHASLVSGEERPDVQFVSMRLLLSLSKECHWLTSQSLRSVLRAETPKNFPRLNGNLGLESLRANLEIAYLTKS